MSSDPYRRTYKATISVTGLDLLETHKIDGIEFPRGVIEHATAQGHKVPLTGVKGITNLEISDWTIKDSGFWDFYSAEDPGFLSGTITFRYQDDSPGMRIYFSDAIPAGGSVDPYDRETEKEHGMTIRLACVLTHIEIIPAL